ncbi:hypothetical protein QBC38DRAFT_445812 [Podospora fimiseda]|uniref:Uncharacterized protein n=1 Tax=Podospora fimiseda TaxID=252190 RepID=A0AAN7BKS6_9PEZI|nr:hypothetical protein QBC38DRAFT_445812 [Podospora fimiseda]
MAHQNVRISRTGDKESFDIVPTQNDQNTDSDWDMMDNISEPESAIWESDIEEDNKTSENTQQPKVSKVSKPDASSYYGEDRSENGGLPRQPPPTPVILPLNEQPSPATRRPPAPPPPLPRTPPTLSIRVPRSPVVKPAQVPVEQQDTPKAPTKPTARKETQTTQPGSSSTPITTNKASQLSLEEKCRQQFLLVVEEAKALFERKKGEAAKNTPKLGITLPTKPLRPPLMLFTSLPIHPSLESLKFLLSSTILPGSQRPSPPPPHKLLAPLNVAPKLIVSCPDNPNSPQSNPNPKKK